VHEFVSDGQNASNVDCKNPENKKKHEDVLEQQ